LKSEWYGGTECDLTGKERRIEVQYHCNPSIGADRIVLIKETSTCAYLMVLHTPRLCNDVAFQPPQKDAANSISCTPILRPEEAETYVHEQKAYKSAAEEAQIWEANPDAAAAFGMAGETGDDELPVQIVGDIIVGGHAIVPEGVKIEKSGIVGGKDKYIDTIANSGGKSLSKEELKKLDRRRQGQPHQPRAQLPLHPPLSASPCSRIDHHSQPLEAFSEKQSFGYLWELEIFVASVLFSSRFELRGMSGLIMIKEG